MSESRWEVKVVRTNFGDLIAEVDVNEPYGPTLTLKKPHIIRLQQAPPAPGQTEGTIRISFSPFMLYSDDDTFVVDRVHVICIAGASPDIRNAFNTQYGSGIIVPTGMPTPGVGQSILLKG